ncbi:unnamed protein product, partial [Owenia fusiformis]
NTDVYVGPNACHRPVCVKEWNVIIIADLTTDADISEYPIESFIMQLGIAPTKVQLGIVAITDVVQNVITISREFKILEIIEAFRNVSQSFRGNGNKRKRNIKRAFKLAKDQIDNNVRKREGVQTSFIFMSATCIDEEAQDALDFLPNTITITKVHTRRIWVGTKYQPYTYNKKVECYHNELKDRLKPDAWSQSVWLSELICGDALRDLKN